MHLSRFLGECSLQVRSNHGFKIFERDFFGFTLRGAGRCQTWGNCADYDGEMAGGRSELTPPEGGFSGGFRGVFGPFSGVSGPFFGWFKNRLSRVTVRPWRRDCADRPRARASQASRPPRPGRDHAGRAKRVKPSSSSQCGCALAGQQLRRRLAGAAPVARSAPARGGSGRTGADSR